MRGSRLVGVGAAALSALALFAAEEPLAVGPLAWVALIPVLLVVLREERPVWAWLYGLAFGVAYFGIHLSWIFLFGWMAWTALTLVMALYWSVAALLGRLVRDLRLAPVLVAGAWTGAELLRDRWPFGGFPWGTPGTAQGAVPGVRWLAGVIGAYGLTFLVVFASAVVACRLRHGRWPWRSLATVAIVLAVFIGVDLVGYGSPSPGRPIRVAVVQGGVPRPPRPDQNAVIVRTHLRLTRQLLRRERVDLVVWPESAIANSVAASGLRDVQELALETGTPFLVGRSFFTGDAYFNQMEQVTAGGHLAGTYSKRHPVPFGEYVPLSFLRSAVGTLQTEIPVDQRPGTEATVFDVGGTTVATPICFESVFPRDFLDFVREGAELFVLSTNNSSFERSYASEQHVAHTRMRALETRQWVVQAALAGISAVLGPDGSVTQRTGLFTSQSFVADVRARPSQSLYAATGDLFPALFAGLAGLGLVYALVRRRRRRQPELESSA